MDKLIVDLHALKTQLELNGCWLMAGQIEKQLSRLVERPCYICGQPVTESKLKNHSDCLSKVYDLLVDRKAA